MDLSLGQSFRVSILHLSPTTINRGVSQAVEHKVVVPTLCACYHHFAFHEQVAALSSQALKFSLHPLRILGEDPSQDEGIVHPSHLPPWSAGPILILSFFFFFLLFFYLVKGRFSCLFRHLKSVSVQQLFHVNHSTYRCPSNVSLKGGKLCFLCSAILILTLLKYCSKSWS